MLSNNIMDYNVVAQGKTTIPGVDDGEECDLTDVRHHKTWIISLYDFFVSLMFQSIHELFPTNFSCWPFTMWL